MDEYIKREDALRQVMMVETRENMYQCVKNIPAADVQPVEHGRWKWSEGGQCSECGFHNSNFGYNYCPNCGARMDGET